MENKTESKVRYDERRKEMIQDFKQTQEIKMGEEVVGESSAERKAVFKEKGIRMVVEDLAGQQMKMEQSIKKMKADLKEAPEMTEELKKLEQDIQTINKFNKNKQLKSQLESQEKDLKAVRKDLREIKEAIGSRLKL